MIRRSSLQERSSLTLGAAGLVGLLALLAVLQYRWAGELGEADLQRLRTSAQDRAVEFGRQFDREITRAFLWFDVSAADLQRGDWQGLLHAHARWQSHAPYPALVRNVYLLLASEKGPPTQLALDAPGGRAVEAAWPTELGPLLARLGGEITGPPPREREPRERDRDRPGAGAVDDGAPAVVIPLFNMETTPDGRAVRPPGRPRPAGYVVVLLDLTYVHDELLPALERRYFDRADGFDYGLEVHTTGAPGQPFYKSADTTQHPETPDASVRILGVRFDAQNRDLLEGLDASRGGPWRRRFGLDDRGGEEGARRGPWERPPGGRREEGTGRWRVALWNRAGGLPEVVAVARHRNLAIGFGILLLLGTSVALLLTTARRAERLARQQVEFVAGVTHELRTPLAVIRSAGENLADGLVGDVSQVRNYGALVRDEGRRLTELVEQVLELAGAESERPPASLKPLEVGRLVDEALESCGADIRAAGVHVERDVPEGLPAVQGDASALKRALRNLIDNAVKYGGEARFIAVRARRSDGPRAPEVSVTVEDHGLGLTAEDLPRLFEPFFRGREAQARQIRGSGLGLSLVRRIVESHGGRVTADAGRERGSAFIITLPAPSDAAPSPGASAVEADAKAHPAG